MRLQLYPDWSLLGPERSVPIDFSPSLKIAHKHFFVTQASKYISTVYIPLEGVHKTLLSEYWMGECIKWKLLLIQQQQQKGFNYKRNLPDLLVHSRSDYGWYFSVQLLLRKSSLSTFVNRVPISFRKHLIFDIHLRFVCTGIKLILLWTFFILHWVE